MGDPVKLALPEVPVDQVREIAQRIPVVFLHLRRKNLAGSMNTIGSLQVNTMDLVDGSLEKQLNDLYGGGQYEVHALNPENHMEEVLPKYRTGFDGPPKTVPNRELSDRERRGLQLHAPAPAGPPAPMFVSPGQAYNPQPLGPNPRDFMSYTPDEIALQQVNELRAEVQRMQSILAEERRASEQKIEHARLESERLRLKLAEEQANRTIALQDERFKSLEAKIASGTAPKTTDWASLAPVFAAVAPIITALVNSSGSRAAAAMEQQSKSLEMQLEGIKTIATAQSKKPDFDLVKMIEVGMPLITLLVNGRDPSKMAELMATMGENQMGMISLVANIMNSMGGDEDTPAMRLAREVLGGVVSVAERMAEAKENAAQQAIAQPRRLMAVPQPSAVHAPPQQPVVQQQPPQRRPPVAGATPQPQGQGPNGAAKPQPVSAESYIGRRRAASGQEPAPVDVPAPAGQGQAQTPDAIARMLLASPEWPENMRNQSWYDAMRVLHDPTVSAEDAAGAFGTFLDALFDAGALADGFKPIFESEEDVTVSVLEPFLRSLPLQKNDPARVDAILSKIAEMFKGDDTDGGDDAAAGASVAETH